MGLRHTAARANLSTYAALFLALVCGCASIWFQLAAVLWHAVCSRLVVWRLSTSCLWQLSVSLLGMSAASAAIVKATLITTTNFVRVFVMVVGR